MRGRWGQASSLFRLKTLGIYSFQERNYQYSVFSERLSKDEFIKKLLAIDGFNSVTIKTMGFKNICFTIVPEIYKDF